MKMTNLRVFASALVLLFPISANAQDHVHAASAEKLGLSPDREPRLDLDEARGLITALAGLLSAAHDYLGVDAVPLRQGLKTLQVAFRESSSFPDEPGHGPGEALLS